MLQPTLLQKFCRVFNIKLSPPQLAAVMASFDKDNDGSVNCAEFLLKFFMIGFQVSEAESRFCVLVVGYRETPSRKACTVVGTSCVHTDPPLLPA